eukprot:2170177-Pleurochrysis_carterae.AAC.3
MHAHIRAHAVEIVPIRDNCRQPHRSKSTDGSIPYPGEIRPGIGTSETKTMGYFLRCLDSPAARLPLRGKFHLLHACTLKLGKGVLRDAQAAAMQGFLHSDRSAQSAVINTTKPTMEAQ